MNNTIKINDIYLLTPGKHHTGFGEIIQNTIEIIKIIAVLPPKLVDIIHLNNSDGYNESGREYTFLQGEVSVRNISEIQSIYKKVNNKLMRLLYL